MSTRELARQRSLLRSAVMGEIVLHTLEQGLPMEGFQVFSVFRHEPVVLVADALYTLQAWGAISQVATQGSTKYRPSMRVAAVCANG